MFHSPLCVLLFLFNIHFTTWVIKLRMACHRRLCKNQVSRFGTLQTKLYLLKWHCLSTDKGTQRHIPWWGACWPILWRFSSAPCLVHLKNTQKGGRLLTYSNNSGHTHKCSWEQQHNVTQPQRYQAVDLYWSEGCYWNTHTHTETSIHTS